MKRTVYVGGLWHETHSFASDITTMENFRLYKLVEGEELRAAFRGTSTEIGGAMNALENLSLETLSVDVVPGFCAGALPSGPIAQETWEELRRRLLASIEASGADAVFLSLHGAMVVQGDPDPEGRLVADVRERVGADVPIAVTLDFHANLGPQLVAAADAVVAYDTYPHTDFAERGAEAAQLLVRMLQGERFAKGLVQLPLIPPVPAQATAVSPMKELMALAHSFEGDDGATFVSWMAGFPYGDVPRMGMSAVITSALGEAHVAEVARTLAKAAWDVRDQFVADVVPVDEAVRKAKEAPRGPVVLVDVADNIGGGTPGDGTALLAELVAQRVGGSVVTIADKESVEAAWQAGVGGRVRMEVGGKADSFHGDPVPFEGTVRWAGDGRFTLTGNWMTGLTFDPGRSAVVENDDGITIVLSERKVPPFDAGVLRSVGLQPETCRVIVAKSAIAWQAAYGAFAAEAIYVDTPGICTPRLERLPYRQRRSPLLPFDEDTRLSDARIHLWSAGERGVFDGQSIA